MSYASDDYLAEAMLLVEDESACEAHAPTVNAIDSLVRRED